MKRISGFLILTLFTGTVFAQEINQKNVPAVVLNAFQLKFPNSTDIKWNLNKGNYNIHFEVNNKENELLMTDRGVILQHLNDLYVSEIPRSVMETIKSKVAFFDVSDADRLDEGGKTSYRIILKISDKNQEFMIDESGKLLKHTKELEDNEVPLPITTIINSKYGSLDIDDAMFMEESGRITYLLKGEINDMEHVFTFDDKAILLKHEQDLRSSEVPLQVMNAAKASYPGYEIRDMDLLEDAGKITYIIALSKSKERLKVIITPDGKILEIKNI